MEVAIVKDSGVRIVLADDGPDTALLIEQVEGSVEVSASLSEHGQCAWLVSSKHISRVEINK